MSLSMSRDLEKRAQHGEKLAVSLNLSNLGWGSLVSQCQPSTSCGGCICKMTAFNYSWRIPSSVLLGHCPCVIIIGWDGKKTLTDQLLY